MAKLIVKGGRRLEGEISVTGSKNSALALMVGAALGKGETILENIPNYTDIPAQIAILRSLGVRVEEVENGSLLVDGTNLENEQAPYELVRKLRASFYVAGLLLGRLGKAKVPFPGGDPFGTRPVDFHLKGFQALGADVNVEYGYMVARVGNLFGRLCGAKFYVNRASFGTTVNLMLAACLADGITILENAAREPEIVDLAMLLNKMGARIKGAGTDVITVEGVQELHGTRHEVIPDRLEAGTYMIGAAVTKGRVKVQNVVSEHVRALTIKLQEAGVEVHESPTALEISCCGRLHSVDVETRPYPGFATDYQAPFVALMTTAEGVSLVRESVFDDRFAYVDELRRMGANIRIEGATAIILGQAELTGAPVETPDIRAGVALVFAGLAAKGETHVHGVHHLDRGYDRIEEKLRKIGAEIIRVEE
ncbi:MAG: UDP-N-acetylglucosamine 1-carboxyvinyltransferase [Syntrophothermus sp.]